MLHLQARKNLNQNNMAVNCLWRRLCIIKSDSKTPQHWNAAARAENKDKITLTAKMHRSSAIFNVYMSSDHATTSSKVTPGPRGCKFACKRWPVFDGTARRVTSPTWGPPPPCKQALIKRQELKLGLYARGMNSRLIIVNQHLIRWHKLKLGLNARGMNSRLTIVN